MKKAIVPFLVMLLFARLTKSMPKGNIQKIKPFPKTHPRYVCDDVPGVDDREEYDFQPQAIEDIEYDNVNTRWYKFKVSATEFLQRRANGLRKLFGFAKRNYDKDYIFRGPPGTTREEDFESINNDSTVYSCKTCNTPLFNNRNSTEFSPTYRIFKQASERIFVDSQKEEGDYHRDVS